MKRRHQVDPQSLAPVVANYYNKFHRGFGINSHDVEDICGAAIVRIAQKFWQEGTNLQDFFERMSALQLTEMEFLKVCACFINEGRNYHRGSTFYKHRRRETGELFEVEDLDVSQEFLEALTKVLDRLRLDFGEESEEYLVALWLLYGDDEERMFEHAKELTEEEWEEKVDGVLDLVRALLIEQGAVPHSRVRRKRKN